jgi:hypothetical protein
MAVVAEKNALANLSGKGEVASDGEYLAKLNVACQSTRRRLQARSVQVAALILM